jgi:hypothetical protein
MFWFWIFNEGLKAFLGLRRHITDSIFSLKIKFIFRFVNCFGYKIAGADSRLGSES